MAHTGAVPNSILFSSAKGLLYEDVDPRTVGGASGGGGGRNDGGEAAARNREAKLQVVATIPKRFVGPPGGGGEYTN